MRAPEATVTGRTPVTDRAALTDRTGGPPHVRLVEVTKRFGAHVAVDRVSLALPEGAFTTLLGPSGCGKTTVLRLVAGFYRPDSGEILLRERPITDVPPHRRHMAMVFQEYALFPHMTVGENVAYGLRMRRVPPRETAQRVAEALRLVGLEGQERRFPHQLSGGQQQRVALARALVVEPEVLLLDEPLSNLDAKLRVRVRTEIRQLQERLGKTTLYVTHDQEEALAISDQIAVMHAGRILQVGTPTEIYFRPQNRVVADFVGLATFVEAEVVGPGRVRVHGVVLPVTGPLPQAGRVTLVVRPEAVRLTPARDGDSAWGGLRGRIVARAFLGGVVRCWVDVHGAEWVVDVPVDQEVPADGVVALQLGERVHALPEGPAGSGEGPARDRADPTM